MKLGAWVVLVAAMASGPPALGQAEKEAAPASPRPGAASRLADPKRVRERLKLSPEYDGAIGVESIRVAVLDYGFEGLIPGRGYLPASAEVVEDYDAGFVRRNDLGDPEYRKAFEPGNRHGRDMAQMIWAVAGSPPGGPKFFLLNANGPTMLRRAVRYAIEQGVQVILFSGSFEGGGNGDGRGPVDRIVAEAVGRGILWINAAGNYGGKVFNAPIHVLSDGYLKLRDKADVAAIRFRNRVDENTVTVTLTWNDYREQEDAGTRKDLDLYVEDWAGRLVGSSTLTQGLPDNDLGPDETRNPRERVVLADLPRSPTVRADAEYGYKIRVRSKRGAFGRGDRLRILVTAARDTYVPPGGSMLQEAVTLFDASNTGEIYPPADAPGVLTIGDAGPASSSGPTLDGRTKPDAILEDSRADFTDGFVSAGSSNAAAFVAAAAIVLKATEPALKPADLIRLAKLGPILDDRTPKSAGKPARPGQHLWQTPTRSKLAEVVRAIR